MWEGGFVLDKVVTCTLPSSYSPGLRFQLVGISRTRSGTVPIIKVWCVKMAQRKLSAWKCLYMIYSKCYAVPWLLSLLNVLRPESLFYFGFVLLRKPHMLWQLHSLLPLPTCLSCYQCVTVLATRVSYRRCPHQTVQIVWAIWFPTCYFQQDAGHSVLIPESTSGIEAVCQ